MANKMDINRTSDMGKCGEAGRNGPQPRSCGKQKYFLAIDIGASSGRHIAGWQEDGKLVTEEVFRFPNGLVHDSGHLAWDIPKLLEYVKEGIQAARKKFGNIYSLSIDTWAVDYVLMKGEEEAWPCFAYRDSRMEESMKKVHEIIPFEELYKRTGIQYSNFNTIYQFYSDKLMGRLEGATGFLMVPEYLMYKLTGAKAHEYTNATSTGLVNAHTQEYDDYIIEKLRLPGCMFGTAGKPFAKLAKPGTYLGEYEGIRVVLCATHDTASAVEGIPLGEDDIFLSSGTWSLLGIKISGPLITEKGMRANYTNEGGPGYIRFLKNIMGLWIIQNLKAELGLDFEEMSNMAETSSYEKIFDVNSKRFYEPGNMRSKIMSELMEKELADRDIINSVYHSLAYSYSEAIKELEDITGKKRSTLVIAGGGAKNKYLNALAERYTGKRVVALPVEATAIGNLKVQMSL